MTFLSFSICIIDEMCMAFRMEEIREDGVFKFQINSLITKKKKCKQITKKIKQQKQSNKRTNNNKHTKITNKENPKPKQTTNLGI